MTAALIGALIVWAIVSPSAALVLGRVIRHRNTQTPRTAVSAGKTQTRRPGASHLKVVR